MTKTRKNLAVVLAMVSLLAMTFLCSANAQTSATLTAATTDVDDVITVNGEGFNASETVSLQLLDTTGTTLVYTFSESATTDENGTFAVNVTLPTGVYGTYNLTATSETTMASIMYTIEEPTTTEPTTTEAAITVNPDDSNIIAVSGSGFNTSESVTLQLYDTDGNLAYNFTTPVTTDDEGNFSTLLIVPTSLSGDFYVYASTSGASANAEISVPDLTGPTGATGDTGETGATGASGADGVAADSTLLYGAVALSVIAMVLALYGFVRKH